MIIIFLIPLLIPIYLVYIQMRIEGERDWLMKINHKECSERAQSLM